MTTQTDTRYNGWANYETWAVKLWIDNEEPSYRYWRHHTEAIWRNAEHDALPPFTRSEYARINLSDALKESYEDNAPEVDGIYADLLQAALGEVDWFEIADALLSGAELAGYEAHA